MAKDYAKFVPKKTRTSRKKTWRVEIALAIFLALVGASAIGYIYYIKKSPNTLATTNPSIFSKMLTAISHHKKENLALTKTKVVALNHRAPIQPVHFDFYNELPNMQMTIPDMTESVTAERDNKPKVITEATNNTQQAIFNPDEVSSLLAEEDDQEPQYIIQVGSFESEESAKRLLSAMASHGDTAEIIKINQAGRDVYRVQQGPYSNMKIAKETQQKLQKRGIVGVIRKA